MLMIDTQFTVAPLRAARTIALTLAVALAACTSAPTVRAPSANTAVLEQRAQAAVAAGNLAAAADLYTELAASAGSARRSGYLLEAARLAADYGDTALARRRLSEARTGANAAELEMSGVLLARLELADGRPQAALDQLGTLRAPLGEAAQSEAQAVRGRALFALGRPVEAVRTLVEREVWLSDADSILANQRLIWDGLRERPPPSTTEQTGDPIVDGWLALAPLTASTGAELRRGVLAWRRNFTTHPAAGGLLAELLSADRATGFPSQVALLLPMSSAQRAAALAIRDGFMAAHLRSSANSSSTIKVYDTAALGTGEAYVRAQLDGADFIVGPLLRPEVDQVAAQAGFVPTLALNYATSDTTALGSFFQFALAPADEAQALALAAAAAGARSAIALVPSNQRGLQIRDDFRTAFEGAGGTLVDWTSYEPALQDFSQTIASLLHVTRSRERQRRLAANLGVPAQFEARRREDVDMIFVVADSRTGRLLASQLRFFGAGDIPTYATSEIFDPASSARDNDLNGFVFADAPAVIAPDGEASSVRAELDAYWPQRSGLVRFYSMGFDAYRLVGSLYVGDSGAWPMRGLSGDLSLDSQGRVRRVLPLARFRGGRPVAIEETAPGAIDGNGLVGSR
jgi:outer membrane PBP1 activator LpoA protein